jgi:hypothetical protein
MKKRIGDSMPRVTVTINDQVYEILRDVQGRFISSTKEEWSFTTVVNMVLLAGLLAPVYMDLKLEDEFWDMIWSFLEDEKVKLDTEAIIDQVAEKIFQLFEKSK